MAPLDEAAATAVASGSGGVTDLLELLDLKAAPPPQPEDPEPSVGLEEALDA